MIYEFFKNIAAFIRELITGVFHPGNGLLFAKSLFFWVIILSLASISTLYIYRQQPQSKKQSTAETPKGDLSLPDTILAEVGKQIIYKSDVKKLAQAQYSKSAITNEVLKKYLENAIEQAILDQEASELNIRISEEEVSNKKEIYESTQSASTVNLDDFVYYQLLKNEIMTKRIKSVNAYVIGFWIPPESYPQESIYAKQRQEGKLALVESETKLNQNETPPLEITKEIYQKFPSLRSILGYNFINFESIKDKTAVDGPKTFVLDPEKLKKINDPEFYDKLASMIENEVAVVERSDDSGGAAIKVVSVNKEGFLTYEEFLAKRIKEKVHKYLN